MREQRGFTLIELMIVVAIIAIIAAIAIPRLMRAMIAANEGDAIGAMRTISSAQATFHSAVSTDTDTDGAGEYGDLILLSNAVPPYIDEVLGRGNKAGYNFFITTDGTDPDVDELMWEATAWPVNYRISGNRTFYIDESGVLRGSDFLGASVNRAGAVPGGGNNWPPIGG